MPQVVFKKEQAGSESKTLIKILNVMDILMVLVPKLGAMSLKMSEGMGGTCG